MKRIPTKFEIYTLPEELPGRKCSRGWRLLREKSQVLASKKARGGERYISFSDEPLDIFIWSAVFWTQAIYHSADLLVSESFA